MSNSISITHCDSINHFFIFGEFLGIPMCFCHLWILVYSTALEDCLAKSQVGYLCVLEMDRSMLFRYFNFKMFILNILRRAEG